MTKENFLVVLKECIKLFVRGRNTSSYEKGTSAATDLLSNTFEMQFFNNKGELYVSVADVIKVLEKEQETKRTEYQIYDYKKLITPEEVTEAGEQYDMKQLGELVKELKASVAKTKAELIRKVAEDTNMKVSEIYRENPEVGTSYAFNGMGDPIHLKMMGSVLSKDDIVNAMTLASSDKSPWVKKQFDDIQKQLMCVPETTPSATSEDIELCMKAFHDTHAEIRRMICHKARKNRSNNQYGEAVRSELGPYTDSDMNRIYNDLKPTILKLTNEYGIELTLSDIKASLAGVTTIFGNSSMSDEELQLCTSRSETVMKDILDEINSAKKPFVDSREDELKEIINNHINPYEPRYLIDSVPQDINFQPGHSSVEKDIERMIDDKKWED